MTRELLQQALDALDTCSTLTTRQWFSEDRVDAAREDIRAHLAAPQAQPAHTEAELNEHTTGVVIFPNDQFREAFRGLIDTGDKP